MKVRGSLYAHAYTHTYISHAPFFYIFSHLIANSRLPGWYIDRPMATCGRKFRDALKLPVPTYGIIHSYLVHW